MNNLFRITKNNVDNFFIEYEKNLNNNNKKGNYRQDYYNEYKLMGLKYL